MAQQMRGVIFQSVANEFVRIDVATLLVPGSRQVWEVNQFSAVLPMAKNLETVGAFDVVLRLKATEAGSGVWDVAAAVPWSVYGALTGGTGVAYVERYKESEVRMGDEVITITSPSVTLELETFNLPNPISELNPMAWWIEYELKTLTDRQYIDLMQGRCQCI